VNDTRAFIRPSNINDASMQWLWGGKNNTESPLHPVYKTGGILFPYTPTISSGGGSANYDDFHATHSNYRQPVYSNSEVNDINIMAEFTAGGEEDARYMISVLWFCSLATKSSFGAAAAPDSPEYMVWDGSDVVPLEKTAGLPPPVLKFSYMGTHMYNDVPVVMASYSYDFPNTLDYVSVAVNPEKPMEKTQVPTLMTMNITLKPYYNPRVLQQRFTLQEFANGDLTKPRYL